MTLPIETDDTIRRRILSICQDHGRQVVDVSRKLALMLDAIAAKNMNEIKSNYDSILETVEEAEKIKTTLITEVASIGNLLVARDDFLRLTFLLATIVDDAEGVAFRLDGMVEKKWKIEKKHLKSMEEIMTLLLEEITRMRETMMTLTFNPDKAVELARNVEVVERKIDIAYRNLIFSIVSDKMPLHTVLTLRDIVEHLERMADAAVDVVDLVRLLAVTT